MEMPYRHLGRSGLKVSLLSFGSWVTFGPQLNGQGAADCLEVAKKAGVNFFDNAEVYAGGASERIMGQAFRDLGWPRWSFVVSTKFYWGLHKGPNMKSTLNRKYLRHAIEGSLERFGLDFVDLVFCHRNDPETPLEETVSAMSEMISSGQALYWGTSEWPANEIRAAWEIADRHHLHKPVMEQPQYNLLTRRKVEEEYRKLYEDLGLGLTTWSPLASGLLSGKYRDGVPDGSRAALPGYEWLQNEVTDESANRAVAELSNIASQIGCTPAQLSIAWCARNPNVSTVITGASRAEQVRENMGALDVLASLDDELVDRLEKAFRLLGH
jgi:voltage-dependent potassium channel beta subunit